MNYTSINNTCKLEWKSKSTCWNGYYLPYFSSFSIRGPTRWDCVEPSQFGFLLKLVLFKSWFLLDFCLLNLTVTCFQCISNDCWQCSSFGEWETHDRLWQIPQRNEIHFIAASWCNEEMSEKDAELILDYHASRSYNQIIFHPFCILISSSYLALSLAETRSEPENLWDFSFRKLPNC